MILVLEAVRYNCHFPTSGGTTFPISANRIFNATELPTTTVSYTSTSTATGESTFQKFKTVIIIMPIVGFLIIVALTGLCCFCCIRHRRKVAKRRRNNTNRWNGALSAAWQPAWSNYPASPYQQQFVMESAVPMSGAIPGHGFGVVEHDGKTYEAGYSNQYVSPEISKAPEGQQPFQFDLGHVQQQHAQDTKTEVMVQQTESHSESSQEYNPPSGQPHAL